MKSYGRGLTCPGSPRSVFRHFKSTGLVAMSCFIAKICMVPIHRRIVGWQAFMTPRGEILVRKRHLNGARTRHSWATWRIKLSIAFNTPSPLLETGCWKRRRSNNWISQGGSGREFHYSIYRWGDLLYETGVNYIHQYRLCISCLF